MSKITNCAGLVVTFGALIALGCETSSAPRADATLQPSEPAPAESVRVDPVAPDETLPGEPRASESPAASARVAPASDASFAVADSFEGTFARGAVASDHPVASAAGAEMLALGGNAVDAAVATMFTLSVVRPYSCGIGGGGFMVIHLPDDPTHGPVTTAINYRETAPAGVDANYFRDKPEGASTRGGHAVATPGSVAGLLYALDRYGSLERQTVMAPAIKAAAEGFAVDAHYAAYARDVIELFEANEGWKTRFGFVWNRFLRQGEVAVGDTIMNPEQALALSLIAQSGIEAFTSGPIGAAIDRAVAAEGGVLSSSDVRGYTPLEVEPLVRDVQGKRFVVMPPPSSGGVAMLQTLALLDARGADLGDPIDTPLEIHRLTEALKHAFADRARFLADPEFVNVPVDRLLDERQLGFLSRSIAEDAVLGPPAYGIGRRVHPALPVEDGGTSHASIVDPFGGAVACTETINLAFGSLVTVPGFGFCLNDQMDDFTTSAENAFGLRQSRKNMPAPGKRPLSSMSPTIVLDEQGVLAVAGASGGPRIISGTTEALLFALSGMDAGEAVSRPRWHHQWLPEELKLEPALMDDAETRGVLEAIGHNVLGTDGVGVVQLIKRGDAGWQAASDPRKGGRPAGF
ncbi:MAG: gamma-glutamyltransferase [Phycisphaerales bacterium]